MPAHHEAFTGGELRGSEERVIYRQNLKISSWEGLAFGHKKL